jgi:hypothetical protein
MENPSHCVWKQIAAYSGKVCGILKNLQKIKAPHHPVIW